MSTINHIGDFPWPGTAPMYQPPYVPTWPQTYTVPQVEYRITVGQTTVTAPTADEVLRLARLAGLIS